MTSTTQLSMFGGSPADVPADDLRDGLQPQAFDRALFDTIEELEPVRRPMVMTGACLNGRCRQCRTSECDCVCHEVTP